MWKAAIRFLFNCKSLHDIFVHHKILYLKWCIFGAYMYVKTCRTEPTIRYIVMYHNHIDTDMLQASYHVRAPG